jgi:hypothetical protein
MISADRCESIVLYGMVRVSLWALCYDQVEIRLLQSIEP